MKKYLLTVCTAVLAASLLTGCADRDPVETYQKIEDAVVGTYEAIEEAVVDKYQAIEDAFVDKYLQDDTN